ncbi:MAG: hypothetical protein ABW223_04295 [Rariglobus sp.]
MRSLISLVCLSLSLIVAGCGTPPEKRLESPSIQITSLQPVGDGYALRLRFVNPNTAPLLVSQSTHALSLGNTHLGRFEDKEPVGVPPLAGASHVAVIKGKLANEIRNYLDKSSGEVTALVESSLTITVSGDDTITLKANGRGLVKP